MPNHPQGEKESDTSPTVRLKTAQPYHRLCQGAKIALRAYASVPANFVIHGLPPAPAHSGQCDVYDRILSWRLSRPLLCHVLLRVTRILSRQASNIQFTPSLNGSNVRLAQFLQQPHPLRMGAIVVIVWLCVVGLPPGGLFFCPLSPLIFQQRPKPLVVHRRSSTWCEGIAYGV